MKQPFKTGARVKLSERGVQNVASHIKRKVHIDWSHRYGIFQHANKEFAYVLWDGRTTLDDVPLPYIEVVEEEVPYMDHV